MKEYIATFKTSRQISPDDWSVYNPTMKITDNTTVKEINDFFLSHVKGLPMQITIIEVEQLIKTEK